MDILDEAVCVVLLLMISSSLMRNMCRVSARFYKIPGRLQGGVSNPGVAVSAMDDTKIQGMIYYIKNSIRLGLHARMPMLSLLRSEKCIIRRKLRKLTRFQEWYLTSTQRNGPRFWKWWKITLENFEE